MRDVLFPSLQEEFGRHCCWWGTLCNLLQYWTWSQLWNLHKPKEKNVTPLDSSPIFTYEDRVWFMVNTWPSSNLIGQNHLRWRVKELAQRYQTTIPVAILLTEMVGWEWDYSPAVSWKEWLSQCVTVQATLQQVIYVWVKGQRYHSFTNFYPQLHCTMHSNHVIPVPQPCNKISLESCQFKFCIFIWLSAVCNV